MGKTRKSLIIAALLLGATLTLVGATFAAASLPSSGGLAARSERIQPAMMPMPSVSASPSAEAGSSSAHPRPTPPASASPAPSVEPSAPKTGSAKKAITYTVKRGDTLSDIAAWFKQHGYGRLYNANKSTIGSDPDLIRPGQRITISQGKMTLNKNS